MKWVTEVHSKAQILQAQIEHARSMARSFGLDEADAIAPYLREVERIYEEEFPLARAMDDSDLVFHIEGPALADHTPKLSLVESIFANIRTQVFSVAKAVANMGASAHLSDKDVELSLSAMAPGSLYIGVKAESPTTRIGQQHLLGEEDRILLATREAMRSIRLVSQYLSDDSPEVLSQIPDPVVRDAALVAVARLAPTGRVGVTKITLASTDHGQSFMGEGLTPKIRTELKHQLKGTFHAGHNVVTLRGEIRELDLDFDRFELRRIDAYPDRSVRCRISPDVFIDLQSLVGERVEVVGLAAEVSGELPKIIQVSEVRVLDGDGSTRQRPLL